MEGGVGASYAARGCDAKQGFQQGMHHNCSCCCSLLLFRTAADTPRVCLPRLPRLPCRR